MKNDEKPRIASQLSVPSISQSGLLDLPDGIDNTSEVVLGSDDWYRYAIAYREAADRLANMSDAYALNLLGPPLLFLYRHSIELHLKSLLVDAGELLDDPQKIPRKHYLRELWNRVRSLLLKIDARSDGPWLVRADQIINQFDELDPGSFAFRYPAGTDGSPSMPKTIRIDPRVIHLVVYELNILLNGASIQISEYQGLKYEGV